MEVLIYVALAVLVVQYILMAIVAVKMYFKHYKNQGTTHLDLTKSA